MKSSTPYYALFLFFIFSSACQGQKKTKEAIDDSNLATPPVFNLLDQDPYFTETKTIYNTYGPRSITRNTLQDSKGRIWLATWEGIMLYDGKQFINFTNKEGLRRWHVFTILEDRKGHIWFGTIGAGVYRYDGTTFTNFTTNEGLAYDRVGCIYEDTKGQIWFGTEKGISVYDGTSFQNFTTADGLTSNDINSVIEDQNGTYWIATRGAACTYNGKAFSPITQKDGSPFTNVRTIIKDKSDHLWFGGNDGLWRFDHTTFINYSTDFTGYIYEDQKGNIWTSSNADQILDSHDWVLSCYEADVLSDEKIPPIQLRPAQGMLFGIMEDSDNHLWIGSVNGVIRYDGATFDFFSE